MDGPTQNGNGQLSVSSLRPMHSALTNARCGAIAQVIAPETGHRRSQVGVCTITSPSRHLSAVCGRERNIGRSLECRWAEMAKPPKKEIKQVAIKTTEVHNMVAEHECCGGRCCTNAGWVCVSRVGADQIRITGQ